MIRSWLIIDGMFWDLQLWALLALWACADHIIALLCWSLEGGRVSGSYPQSPLPEAARDHVSCPGAEGLTHLLPQTGSPLCQLHKIRITADLGAYTQRMFTAPIDCPSLHTPAGLFVAQATRLWGIFGPSVETSELKLSWKPRDLPVALRT